MIEHESITRKFSVGTTGVKETIPCAQWANVAVQVVSQTATTPAAVIEIKRRLDTSSAPVSFDTAATVALDESNIRDIDLRGTPEIAVDVTTLDAGESATLVFHFWNEESVVLTRNGV